MTDVNSPSYAPNPLAAVAEVDERLAFLKRAYVHLAGAIALFIAVEWALFQTPLAEEFAGWVYRTRFGWLGVLAAFMFVGHLADKWARSSQPRGTQYAGLVLFTVAEAILFLPLLYVAAYYSSPDVIPAAAITTLSVFIGLTLVVFITRADFSFLRTALWVGAFLGLGTIVVSILFGFQLPVLFSFLMAALACGFVLYDTSNMLHRYRTDQHVAAALGLFAAIALMFWYILRIFLHRD